MRPASLVAGAAAVAALVVAGACGGDDSQPLVEAPQAAPADALWGTWQARQPGGYILRYVFRRDGTYTHFSGQRDQRPDGLYTYSITARGRAAVRGRTLMLTPRSGTIERRYAGDPEGDFKRALDKAPQRYQWTVRGSGRNARLTLALGGRLAVTYRRG